jgi:hypothetical protein
VTRAGSARSAQAAAAKYRDDKIDISDCGAKVRKLIEEAVSADGIQILVKQVSLFTPEFEEKLKALKSNEAQASEMEHAIRHEIHVKLEENPVFYTSLRERLEQLIEDRKAKRIDAAEQLKLFEDLRKELRGHADAAEKAGLSETGFAIYGILAEPKPLAVSGASGRLRCIIDDAKRELASLLEEQLEPQVTIVDWTRKDDVQREMRKRIKRQLRAAGYKDEKIEPMAESIVDLLKRQEGSVIERSAVTWGSTEIPYRAGRRVARDRSLGNPAHEARCRREVKGELGHEAPSNARADQNREGVRLRRDLLLSRAAVPARCPSWERRCSAPPPRWAPHRRGA